MPISLLTGATGFVGSALADALEGNGWQVRCTSRDVNRARRLRPDRSWVELDVHRPETLGPALEGCTAAYFLVHAMGPDSGGGDYEAKESAAAKDFAKAAERAGVERIIYLGGVAPSGKPSKHLRSRLKTGECLREGSVPVLELRAGMIVGVGSESWQIVRDLSMRLPVMLLPSWLQNRSQPVAIRDVVRALSHARTVPLNGSACYALPGPEALSGQEILERVARLRGVRPVTVRIPFVSPRLSSYWIKWVTRADFDIARELVQGLTSDLVAQEPSFWPLMPNHELTRFDDAAREAIEQEARTLPLRTLAFEWAMQRMSLRSRKGKD